MKREPFLLKQKKNAIFLAEEYFSFVYMSYIRLVIFKSHDAESQSPAMDFHNPAMDFHNPTTDFQSPIVGS